MILLLVNNYGRIARSLTQLLKKDNFSWTVEAQSTMDNLKRALVKLPFFEGS